MDVYEEVKAWLIEEGAILDIDRCGPKPGDIGLFPQGVQVLRQWEDVLGNVRRRVRYRFILRITAPPGEATATMLLRMQAEAAKKDYAATDAKLLKAASNGLVTYEVRLSAEREEQV